MFISPKQAVEILNANGIVALPTETVYGLAANATNENAIQKVFAAKNRPADNPLIVHFKNKEQLLIEVDAQTLYLETLINHFSPGPLSYLLKLKEGSKLKYATAGSDFVVARIPDQKIFLQILSSIPFPLAAPSANSSGKISPTNAQMVAADLGNKIDGIVDGGICAVGLESTIIDCTKEKAIHILRPGIIGKKELETVLANAFPAVNVFNSDTSDHITPGKKYKHYAPSAPVFEIKQLNDHEFSEGDALLITQEQQEKFNTELKKIAAKKSTIIILGKISDAENIATHLYSNLKNIDNHQCHTAYILQTDWGTSSAAIAIANRLRKIIQTTD